MRAKVCLFGGALFTAGLAPAPAPAGVDPVSISSSNSGFTATLDGTPISDFAQNTGPTGPIAYIGAGLDVFAEATTSRFAARISLDPSDTS